MSFKIKLIIAIKLGKSFVFTEKKLIETTKEKANQWLRDQGLKDFEALNINYTVTGSLLR